MMVQQAGFSTRSVNNLIICQAKQPEGGLDDN